LDEPTTIYGERIERWRADLCSRKLARGTIVKKIRMMKQAAIFANANGWPEDPAEITEEQMTAYKVSHSLRSYRARMLRVSNLRQFIAWAKEEKAEASGPPAVTEVTPQQPVKVSSEIYFECELRDRGATAKSVEEAKEALGCIKCNRIRKCPGPREAD
jgi:hypothetical protein